MLYGANQLTLLMEGGQAGAEGDGWIIIDRKASKKKNKQEEPDGEGCDQVTKGDRRNKDSVVNSKKKKQEEPDGEGCDQVTKKDRRNKDSVDNSKKKGKEEEPDADGEGYGQASVVNSSGGGGENIGKPGGGYRGSERGGGGGDRGGRGRGERGERGTLARKDSSEAPRGGGCGTTSPSPRPQGEVGSKPPQGRGMPQRRYSKGFRKEVGEFGIINRNCTTSRKYGVPESTVHMWVQKALAASDRETIVDSRITRYSDAFRIQVVQYALSNGQSNAAKKFNVPASSVCKWTKKQESRYQSSHYTSDFRSEVVRHARHNSQSLGKGSFTN